MSINFRALNARDQNYSRVIDLYKTAFTTVRNIPGWILKLKLSKGKVGFNSIYDANTWLGLMYSTEHMIGQVIDNKVGHELDHAEVVFVHFFAISDSIRSGGYGSKVLDSLKAKHLGKRIILNVENLDEQESNYAQRVKRRAFYEKNGFVSSGYVIEDSCEQLDMLIYGGSINKAEIDQIYGQLFKGVVRSWFKPTVLISGGESNFENN